MTKTEINKYKEKTLNKKKNTHINKYYKKEKKALCTCLYVGWSQMTSNEC